MNCREEGRKRERRLKKRKKIRCANEGKLKERKKIISWYIMKEIK